MLPLSYDWRDYYRKHQTGTEEDDSGNVTPIYETEGPYTLAFRPGSDNEIITEQGYSVDQSIYLVIADGCDCFRSRDILTDGSEDLYEVLNVKTFPTEQLMYVREVSHDI